jgi:hypothetical protein
MRVQDRDDDVVAGARSLVFPPPDPEDPIEIVVRDVEHPVRVVPREVLGLVRELLERPVAVRPPPRFAMKRFLPFHRAGISSTSASETSSLLALGLYVKPIGSGLLVGHEEVIVALTSDALVAAEAGTVVGRSEQTTEMNMAVRRAFFKVHLVVGSRNHKFCGATDHRPNGVDGLVQPDGAPDPRYP